MNARPRANYQQNIQGNFPNQINNVGTNNLEQNANQNNLNDPNFRRNRSGQTPQQGNNLFLPVIENNSSGLGNQGMYMNGNQRVLQSREKERNESSNINQVGSDGYIKNNNSNPNDYLFNEINNLKKLVRKLIEGQAETQLKLNDYTKTIADQENVFRINNLKINEHDTKITEILMTFNNYLSLNDESTKLINELNMNYESVAKKNEVIDMRNRFFNMDKTIEAKFLELSGRFEDLNAKYLEIAKEQEVFQKYTLEKLKNYQLDNADNKIMQQQAIIKLEESKENKVMFQIDTLRNLLRNCEKSIKAEETMRKSSMENLKSEFINMISSVEEKLAFAEKNSLETEKKMLTYSKDYIAGMRDLLSQSQQKTDIDIRALKSIVEANVARIDNRLEDTLRIVEDSTNEVKAIHKQVQGQYTDLDTFIRENFDGIEEKLASNLAEINRSKEKIKKLSQTVKLLLNDNIQLIETKIAEGLKSTDFKFTKYIDDLNDNMRSLSSKMENLLMNQKENIEMMKKEYFEYNEMMKEKIEKKLKEVDVDNLYIDKKINERFDNLKDDQSDFKALVLEKNNERIEEMKKEFTDEYSELFKKLSESIENKLNIMKKDEAEKKRLSDIAGEGRLQGYIIESEKRIKKNLEERIDKLQQNVERLNIKLNAV